MNHINPINQAALDYWRHTRYSEEEIDKVCQEIDATEMALKVTFHGNGDAAFAVSRRAWERKSGHYPTMLLFLRQLAQHPSLRGLRGAFIILLEDALWDRHLRYTRHAPILSFGRAIDDHCSFLIPDPAFLETGGYEDDRRELATQSNDRPWESRQPTVFWRGAASGLGIEGAAWERTARGRLTLLAREINDPSILDARMSRVRHLSLEQQQIMEGHGVLDASVPFERFLDYRYVVDADGYGCAWRSFFLKLLSGSLVLKISSRYEQWYFRQLIPWQHYVPLASDLSDFRDIFAWLRNHDEAARQIVAQAKARMASITLEQVLDESATLLREIFLCQRGNSADDIIKHRSVPYDTGFIAGAFDLLHPGYIAAFQEAKKHCRRLIVGLHVDPTIERPGKMPPVVAVEHREQALRECRSVDEVIRYRTEDELTGILERVRPDVRFLGDDYKGRRSSREHLGIPTVYLDRSHGFSMTETKRRIAASVVTESLSQPTAFTDKSPTRIL